MLTKYKDVRPKKGANKTFDKYFHVFRIFSGRRHQISTYFQANFFGRIILKHDVNKKALRYSGGMLPRKIFEILHTAVTILLLFEKFSGKFIKNFLPPNSECFTK